MDRNENSENEVIEKDEVILALKKIKLVKVAGRDNIIPEFIKYGEEMVKCLQNLFQKMWSQKKIP